MSVSALGRLKNHNVPHLHPNSTMFMPLDRLQLKIYAFSGKFNVCSKHVLLSWIKNCRDFTLQTHIFTRKYRSYLRFYSEFLRKKLAAEGSGPQRFLHFSASNTPTLLNLVWNPSRRWMLLAESSLKSIQTNLVESNLKSLVKLNVPRLK